MFHLSSISKKIVSFAIAVLSVVGYGALFLQHNFQMGHFHHREAIPLVTVFLILDVPRVRQIVFRTPVMVSDGHLLVILVRTEVQQILSERLITLDCSSKLITSKLVILVPMGWLYFLEIMLVLTAVG